MHDNIFRIVCRLCDRGHNNKSDRIMEENSMVRDLITKILDETGPSEGSSSSQSDKTLNPPNAQYPKHDGNFIPPTCNYQNNLYNFTPEQNSFNYNGFNTNGFGNYPENDINILGVDQTDSSDVTPEQLNLLRLAAQEIGGAQFTSPNNEKFYNFFDPNQRTSQPETNMFQNNFNRPNSLNLDMNYQNNTNFDNQFVQRSQENDLLSYLSNLHISNDRRDDNMIQNMDFKMPQEMNGHFNDDKMMYNRNVQPPKYNDFFMNDMMQNQVNPNFDFANQTPVSAPNMNYKPNGYHQDFMRNPREFHNDQRNYDNREMQQMTLVRRNQELARQMSILMRNQPPPNQLNVDVSFLHENAPFNLGLGTMLGPSPPVPPPVLPSPMMDMPLLAPFYAMRNMRTAATSSAILHARLDVCYEQWRQLERERKRTEARLALAYPGRAVSSSNSIPVPRLPPAPTRVDRLTVDMLREHTKVLTLMGKMETLRASVCVAQNKKTNKSEDAKITVLKRGQENVEKDGVDPASFNPASWREDVNNLAEIAPHSEVESAMLAWRASVCGVQCARQRELARPAHRDPILQLAEAVKQLAISARRARTAMWCDLTLTVALAQTEKSPPPSAQGTPSKQNPSETNTVPKSNADTKEDKTPDSSAKTETKTETSKTQANKQTDKQEKTNQRRTQNFRHKPNQGRNDFYPKNQRYETRFMNHRHPYHYLATGPIN